MQLGRVTNRVVTNTVEVCMDETAVGNVELVEIQKLQKLFLSWQPISAFQTFVAITVVTVIQEMPTNHRATDKSSPRAERMHGIAKNISFPVRSRQNA